MSFAPQQNWDAYHALVAPIEFEKDRSLNPIQKLQRYAEIFDSVWSLKTPAPADRCIDPCEDETFKIRAKQLLAYRNVPGPDRD